MGTKTPLELLTVEHSRPLERFERTNRAFFAACIGDRGDDYFEDFDDRVALRVAENVAATSLYFVLLDLDGEVLGRINLSDLHGPGPTELGFRIAEHAQGRGLATSGVTEALEIAAGRGVTTVVARAAVVNAVSRRVLQRCGLVSTGGAQVPDGASGPFVGYRRDLGASGSADVSRRPAG